MSISWRCYKFSTLDLAGELTELSLDKNGINIEMEEIYETFMIYILDSDQARILLYTRDKSSGKKPRSV